jgi:hypothetical protein
MEEVTEMTLAKFVLIMNCQLIKGKRKEAIDIRKGSKMTNANSWYFFAQMFGKSINQLSP